MVRKAYAIVKFSCKRKKNYCLAGGEKARMSRKRQGSHKVENKTLLMSELMLIFHNV